MPRRAVSIALCVIARDEERFIADCVDSARKYVDEIVVVDTGSTDRTREIAREHGARVTEFVWIDDFAAARNAAIEAANSDWILMLDADERLDPVSGPLLRKLVAKTAPHVHAIAPRIENWSLDGSRASSTTTAVPRFFPRRTDLRFVGAIHEVIKYLPDPDRTMAFPAPELRIIHYGYDAQVYQERRKDARNLALLEREAAGTNDDPRIAFFILQQHLVANRWAEAVAAFEKFHLEIPRLPRAFAVEGYHFYIAALTQLGNRAALGQAEADAAERGLLGSSTLEVLSDYFSNVREVRRAIQLRLRALEPGLPEGLERVDGRGSWATRMSLAGLYDELGDADAALDQLDQAFDDLPEERRGDVSYQALLHALRTDRLEAAKVWAPRAVDCAAEVLEDQQKVLTTVLQLHTLMPGLNLDSPWSAVDSALAGDDLQLAFDLAAQVSPHTMAGMARLLAVVEQVRDAGEHEAALVLLNRALDGPKLEQVYWLLIKTLTQLGRYQNAQLAVEALRHFQGELKAA
jgi:tetratricopeptide (TPR) repeat protein